MWTTKAGCMQRKKNIDDDDDTSVDPCHSATVALTAKSDSWAMTCG